MLKPSEHRIDLDVDNGVNDVVDVDDVAVLVRPWFKAKALSVAISAPTSSRFGGVEVGAMGAEILQAEIERDEMEDRELMEDEIEDRFSVLDWCLRHGNMCDHPADFSTKVARIIDLGVQGVGGLPPAESFRDVPGASVGSWWITEVAIDDDDLDLYKFLAIHAAAFREEVWGLPRQLKWAKYVLGLVEVEMKTFRIRRCFAQMGMELVPVGQRGVPVVPVEAPNMDVGRLPGEGPDPGSSLQQVEGAADLRAV